MVFPSLQDTLKETPQITRQLISFTKTTHLPLRIVSLKGEELWQTRIGSPKASICNTFGLIRNQRKTCLKVQRRAVKESIRWGEAIIGKCCHPFMQITAPVMYYGHLIGYLSASPFLLFDPSELQPEEFTSLRGKEGERKRFERVISKVPVIRDDETNKASKLLFQLADQLSIPDLSCLLQVREIQKLQGKIVDQISDLKSSGKDFNPGSLTKLSYDQEKEIVTRIRLGDREGAKEILYRLLAILLSQYLENFDLLKISVLELLIVMTRAAVEAGTKIEEVLGMKYRFITESAAIKNQENLCIWVIQMLEKLMDRIYQARNVKNYQRLKGALDFIEAHYQDPLTVEQIARKIYLSPSRLSHIIKDELGLTLGDYLSKVRVENAKGLLRQTEMSIAQVALEVGFSDQSYFTKVFKKTEKCTPKVFRQNSSPQN
jgi:two-component system, response regulator YesN